MPGTGTALREHDLAWLLCGVHMDEGRPVTERVRLAAAALLVSAGLEGMKAVKTADVAKRAGTTESTLFRYFANQEAIYESLIEWSWTEVNSAVAAAAFDLPDVLTYRDLIARDVGAILKMYDQPEQRLAASVAFRSLLSQRWPSDDDSSAFARFMRRMVTLISGIMRDLDEPAGDHLSARGAHRVIQYLAGEWQAGMSSDLSPEIKTSDLPRRKILDMVDALLVEPAKRPERVG